MWAFSGNETVADLLLDNLGFCLWKLNALLPCCFPLHVSLNHF